MVISRQLYLALQRFSKNPTRENLSSVFRSQELCLAERSPCECPLRCRNFFSFLTFVERPSYICIIYYDKCVAEGNLTFWRDVASDLLEMVKNNDVPR